MINDNLYDMIIEEETVTKTMSPNRKAYDVRFKMRVIAAYYNEHQEMVRETARNG